MENNHHLQLPVPTKGAHKYSELTYLKVSYEAVNNSMPKISSAILFLYKHCCSQMFTNELPEGLLPRETICYKLPVPAQSTRKYSKFTNNFLSWNGDSITKQK
jgi:hypothetical protein